MVEENRINASPPNAPSPASASPPGPVIPYSSPKTEMASRPRALRFKPLWPVVMAGVTSVGLAGGTFLYIVDAAMHPVLGATRSARLKWEQRQDEIERTIQQEDAQAAKPDDPRGGEGV